jgi:hypothetical protein
MSVLNGNTLIGASGTVAAGGGGGAYTIDNSLRFNDDDTPKLTRTPSSAGNRKTWTWSGWVKRGDLTGSTQVLFSSGASSSDAARIQFSSNDVLAVLSQTGGGSSELYLVSDAVYRDSSAWYHIVVAVDTTQATSADRAKVYVNGVAVSLSTATMPSQNYNTYFSNNVIHTIGRISYTTSNYLDGYLSEVNFIDGLALTPSSFGEFGTYGEWKPLAYAGSYGTNGFYLDFANSGDLGNDVSGNANDWTPTNLAATDQMLDSPTNNFCTFLPTAIGVDATLSEGNLEHVYGSSSTRSGMSASIGMESGKWYWEVVISASSVSPCQALLGIANTHYNPSSTTVGIGYYPGKTIHGWGYYGSSGQKYGDLTTASYGSTYAANDIIGLAYDADNGDIFFYKNGVIQDSGTAAYTGLSGVMYPSVGSAGSTETFTGVANFGQDSSFAGNKTAQGNSDANGIGDFYYTPPAGFLALCTQNLPEPTIIPSEHFNTALYTGNGSAQSITGAGFQPDFTWIKSRSQGDGAPYGGNHSLFDSIRGVGITLFSNLTNDETSFQSTSLTSFDADGFSIGDKNAVNYNGDQFAAWNWKANGAGVSNTDGTITSTVSANVGAGFSIVSWVGGGAASGTSVGHGLSQPPEILILKSRDSSASYEDNWTTYTTAVDGTLDYLSLNTTDAKVNSGFAVPTSSVFTPMNADVGDNVIGYAFHSVDGYSKVGSYTGNGNSSGPFVHCGFRPAYVLIKRSDSANSWFIYDNKRDEYNVMEKRLYANLSSAEAAGITTIDMLSNGFKIRDTNGGWNTSGGTYIFLAFAESPFKYSNAR